MTISYFASIFFCLVLPDEKTNHYNDFFFFLLIYLRSSLSIFYNLVIFFFSLLCSSILISNSSISSYFVRPSMEEEKGKIFQLIPLKFFSFWAITSLDISESSAYSASCLSSKYSIGRY